jgi:hypothetical protein
MFLRSQNAAKWPAVIYSFCAIAKNYGVSEFDYFKEFLIELPNPKHLKFKNS